jgi:hypothetical protein
VAFRAWGKGCLAYFDAKAKELALEILKLDEPSQWQLERIIQRAIDYGRGEANPFPENEGT